MKLVLLVLCGAVVLQQQCSSTAAFKITTVEGTQVRRWCVKGRESPVKGQDIGRVKGQGICWFRVDVIGHSTGIPACKYARNRFCLRKLILRRLRIRVKTRD